MRTKCDRNAAHPLVRGDDGIVLIFSYLTIAVLLIVQTTHVQRLSANYQLTHRYVRQLRALHMSEAGTDWTLAQLRYRATYPGSPELPLGNGTHRSVVTPTGNIDTATDVLPWVEYRARSTGAYPADITQREERTVTSVLAVQPWPFTYGLFAGGRLRVTGDLEVISYDSRLTPMPPWVPLGTWGRVGSNSTTQGPPAIQVIGDLDTDGAFVGCGPGCKPAVAIQVTGSENIQRGALDEVKNLPAPRMCDPADNQPLNIPALTTEELSPGVHCLSNLTLEAGATLTSSGPVTILLNGSLVTAPGARIIAYNNAPPNMLIYATLPTGGGPVNVDFTQVTVVAALYLYGAINVMHVDQMELAGSLITNSAVNMTGDFEVRYDLALSGHGVGADRRPYEFISSVEVWREE